MTYIGTPGGDGGDGGDQYTGLDRFNRVIDVRWMNNSSVDIDRFKYTFSRASNRLTRQNTLTTGFDEQYVYDGLYQITDRKRGTLSGGVITGTPTEEEQFSFDPTGNWPTYLTKDSSGTTTLNQTRTHQLANEINAISPSGSTGYDANGNMTTMPEVDVWATAQTVTYDAWNRPITVTQSGTLGTYQYDGLDRRIFKTSTESGSSVTRHFYYSNQWQVLEERTGTSTSADRQYIWGTRYQDDLVLRDRLVGTTDRFYALADYFQATSLSDTSGVIQERYVYRAFGDVSYYTSTWSTRTASLYAWSYLYGGYQLDLETNLYQVRNRYYHSALGRWLSRDPFPDAELSQGSSLYWYVSNNPVNAVDFLGLATVTVHVIYSSSLSRQQMTNAQDQISRLEDNLEKCKKWCYDLKLKVISDGTADLKGNNIVFSPSVTDPVTDVDVQGFTWIGSRVSQVKTGGLYNTASHELGHQGPAPYTNPTNPGPKSSGGAYHSGDPDSLMYPSGGVNVDQDWCESMSKKAI